jgi:hypothetical protein
MKTLTNEQMAALAPFEGRMQTALRSNWCAAVSAHDFNVVLQIYNSVTGGIRRNNPDCASCVLELFSDMGRIYFAQRDSNARKVEQSPIKAEKRAKIAVKTAKN